MISETKKKLIKKSQVWCQIISNFRVILGQISNFSLDREFIYQNAKNRNCKSYFEVPHIKSVSDVFFFHVSRRFNLLKFSVKALIDRFLILFAYWFKCAIKSKTCAISGPLGKLTLWVPPTNFLIEFSKWVFFQEGVRWVPTGNQARTNILFKNSHIAF